MSSIAYCFICKKPFNTFGDKRKSGQNAYKKHMKEGIHDDVPKTKLNLQCIDCNQPFERTADHAKHVCTRVEKLKSECPEIFTEYTFKEKNSVLPDVVLDKLNAYELYLLCYTEKICIENSYPALCMIGRQNTMNNVTKYGNTNGADFMCSVLEQKYKLTGENGVWIDAAIDVMGPDGKLFSLPPDFLAPSSTRRLNVIGEGNKYFITLKELPKPPQDDLELNFDDVRDSSVYMEYYENGRPPHSFTKKETEDINTFRNIHKMEAKSLRHLVGMRCSDFWSFCRRMQLAGLKTCKALNLPSMVALYRSKIRKGWDFDTIETTFRIGKGTAHNIFWAVAFTHFRVSNVPVCQWKNDLPMETKNALYREFTKVSPYFDYISKRFEDPWEEFFNVERKCIFVLIDSTKGLYST